jgi:hypothetical protein
MDEITLRKEKDMLIIEWVSSNRNDIAADHLCILFSQFPADKEADIFRGKSKISDKK